MKRIFKTHLGPSLLLLLGVVSCANLLETKRKENPDFVNNAERLIITSPLTYSSSTFNKFILEDPKTAAVYEIKPMSEDPDKDVSTSEQKGKDGSRQIRTNEFVSYKFLLSNPLDLRAYDVIGKTNTYRSGKETDDSDSELSKMIYPVEFFIFEKGKDAGKIVVNNPGLTKTEIEISLHNKVINVIHQDQLANESYTFEDESGLLAMVLLKPKGAISDKKTGEILLGQGLPEDIRSDIVSMYLIVATMFSMIDEAGI